MQRSVTQQFERLSEDGPVHLNASSARAGLHLGEWCSLQESGVADELDPGGSRINASQCMAARQSSSARRFDLREFYGDDRDVGAHQGEVKIIRPCWVQTPKASLMLNPVCTISPENLAMRRTMLSRFDRVAAGSPAQSHLRQGMLNHGSSILFYGDSLVWDLFQAARCEALRSDDSAQHVKQIEFIDIYEGYRRRLHLTGVKNTHAAVLGPKLSSFGNQSGGMIVASIGHHYNNFHAPKTGHVEGFDVGIRSQYQTQLKYLVDVLEEYGSRGHGHTAVLLTPALQHFETADGSFAPSVFNSTGYGCHAGPRASELRNTTSANFWRSDDLMRSARARAPHVLVVPQHEISWWWWDHHPGSDGRRKTISKGALSKSTTDCTHFCHGPFLYEPIWWALRQLTAATRTHQPHERYDQHGPGVHRRGAKTELKLGAQTRVTL